MKAIKFVFIIIIATAWQTRAGDDRAAGLALHRKILTLDTHCDTPLRMLDPAYDVGRYHPPGARGSGKIDLPRMQGGNLDAEFFAVFVAQRECTPENYARARSAADQLLLLVEQMCSRNDTIAVLSRTPGEARRNHRRGLLSIYIGVENGFALGHDLDRVAALYDRGVRYITLCHTLNNDLCDSSTDPAGPAHHGVSEFGRQVIAEMNRLGMLIDVSHAADRTVEQVLTLSRAPVFASHSGCRALCDHPRNLSDELIRALAARGGVVQVCVFSEYLRTLPANPQREAAFKQLEAEFGPWDEIVDPERRKEYRNRRIEIDARHPRPMAAVTDVVDHIEHVIRVAGIDHVGIGTDFDGGGGVTDCNDVTEMPNLTLELLRRGYSRKEIEKIWGGNFLRLFRRAARAAGEGTRR